MKSIIILILYLTDQLFGMVLPVSSGLFVMALLSCYFGLAKLYTRVVYPVFTVFFLLFGFGLFGAYLSGTDIGVISIATPVLLALVWVIGGGMQGGKTLIFSTRLALVGVLTACGFLILSRFGFDLISLAGGSNGERRVGLFREPSHYALYVLPLWLIAYEEKRYRKWLYSALFAQLAFAFSATAVTMLAIIVLLHIGLVFRFSSRDLSRIVVLVTKIFVLGVAAYFVSLKVQVDDSSMYEYVADRVANVFAGEGARINNLSSLVILQGIEIAEVSFEESRGFGVGLGNLGTSQQILNKVSTRDIIALLMGGGGDLNLRDGGLLANKLVGEMGAMAVLLPFLLFTYLRKIKNMEESGRWYHAVWAATLITLLFVRTVAMFAGPVVLALLSWASVVAASQRKKDTYLTR